MLIVKCTTDFALREPDAETGFVSWFDMSIHHADSELGALGGARVALIHGGEACNYGEPIVDVLDADSAELHDLYSVFYDDDGGLKPPYANGGGQDVIYFSELEVATGLQGSEGRGGARTSDHRGARRRVCNRSHACGRSRRGGAVGSGRVHAHRAGAKRHALRLRRDGPHDEVASVRRARRG